MLRRARTLVRRAAVPVVLGLAADVALGDSYSARPLIPDPRTDPFPCFRSTNNYPAFVAGYLGSRRTAR